MLRKRERRLIKRRRISKMRSNYRRQRQIQLKKLLPKQRTLPLSPKKMPLIGRRLPRQPSLKPQKRWLRLKKQPKLRKRCFWPNKRATRKLTMKPSQLKLLPSKRLKNKPKKHRKQLLQLEKHRLKSNLPQRRNSVPNEKLALTNYTQTLGQKVQLEFLNSNLWSPRNLRVIH